MSAFAMLSKRVMSGDMSVWQKLKCKLRFHKTQDIAVEPFTWKRCFMCGKQFGVKIIPGARDNSFHEETKQAFDPYEGPY